MKLKDLLLEAGTAVDNLAFGPSDDNYDLVINFDKKILDTDAAHSAIEDEFDELISNILSAYDECDYAWKQYDQADDRDSARDAKQEAKAYEKDFKTDGKKLKSLLQAAIKAGKIPGIDKTTKIVEIEHPGIS